MHAFSETAAQEVLRQQWGHAVFRPHQLEIIRDVVEGRDVLAVLPTGGGKSLCYQVPALLVQGVTLVVSPLIALMQDQVDQLRSRGVQAVTINSGMAWRRREEAWAMAEHGGCRLVYVSPETLQSEVFQSRAPRLSISRVAVDEAHCVSEWGHDFRPAYLRIREALAPLGPIPLTALTATAPPRVRSEIVTGLEMVECREHVGSTDRPNVALSVIRETNLLEHVLAALAATPGQAVLYAGTRANSEAWAARLSAHDISCEAYHAGLTMENRKRTQARWIEDTCRVVAATSAFGMGIDKADVRVALHTMLPTSLEAYSQEAGRAGRDGQAARAVLVASPADDSRLRQWADDRYPRAGEIQAVYRTACDMASIPVGSGADEAFVLSAERVARAARTTPARVAEAARLLASFGVWRQLGPSGGDPLIIPAEDSGLRRAVAEDSSSPVRQLAGALLRCEFPEGPGDFVRVPVREVGRLSGLSPERVMEGLRFFRNRGILPQVVDGEDLLLALEEPRSSKPALDGGRIGRLRRRAADRSESVIAYAAIRDCRRRMLRSYFGESAPAQCGACDNCLR